MTNASTERVTIKFAVRELISFALRSGSLPTRRLGQGAGALEGIRGHQRVQRSRGKSYIAEAPVRHTHVFDDFDLEIAGRIDGVDPTENPVIVEEIKTTRREFEDIGPHSRALHQAQGKLYAYLYAIENDLAEVKVRLTYFHLDTHKMDCSDEVFSLHELQSFYEEVLEVNREWAVIRNKHELARNESLDALTFPYPEYRTGQRRFAAEVYRAIRDKGLLFAQAPTGIGKTLGVWFPSLKAMAEKHGDRIFFLTAKTVGRSVAQKGLSILRNQGLRFRAVTLTARDKSCFGAPSCDPSECIYAQGYYDRLRQAQFDAFNYEALDRETIIELAEKHQLCPFELSLDLAENCDGVICDYNYAFDPAAHLRRFFSEKSNSVLLVDESHNLVDRARAMYSAELNKRSFMETRKLVKDEAPEVAKALNGVNRAFLACLKDMSDDKEAICEKPPEKLEMALRRFCHVVDQFAVQHPGQALAPELLDNYFEALRYGRTLELYGKDFVTIQRAYKKDLDIHLYCLDPSRILKQFLDKSRSTVFFSATLNPFEYFTRLLIAESEPHRLALPSPFPSENLCLAIASSISTRYADRERSLQPITAMIVTLVGARKGNYLIFFPSYRYMQDVYACFTDSHPDMKTMIQKSGMDESARDAYLAAFEVERDETLVAFAVMGGIFGEGIDLTGEKLIGVAVVGPGLPALSLERNLIRDHFDKNGEDGFAFAYQFPGLSRVLQTAGRVIRTEQDRGVVCLIDQRFTQHRYRMTFPPEWRPVFTPSPEHLKECLDAFWEDS